nr:adenosine triphosphate 8 [Amynthas sp. FJ201005-01]QED22631.1 adenosine triphosphate 8 [Amynthas sp. ZJ201522-03]QED22633.1 adenosine triphosphate 8 [Amynthas sp. ZJ201521-01]QED22634.1 adenosine triphosphate 8 [Amynthas sp. HK201601-06]QED22635.1 adenosine triphosphate 8 [Amynthas sp. GD201117-14]QED22649.1 adenosine triphosphate 8 [Amynthas sp. FJ201112-03]QED22652.1 adenosine triphosphate 8 [Amynthas sp. GX201301-02]
MPHLSPMSWLVAIIFFWAILMLFTSNIWWTNLHTFETDSPSKMKGGQLPWCWTLQDGWD